MNITAPEIEDAPGIATVHIRSWQAAYASILPRAFLDSLNLEERTERWKAILRAKESTTLVAKSESGAVAGFVSFGRCRDESAPPAMGEVWSLYALPEYWNKGVGRLLLSHALERLRTSLHESVSLWVLSENERARKFYAAAGFELAPGDAKRFELGGIEVDEVRLVYRYPA